MARLKATHGMSLDSTGVKFNTILMLAQKTDLTNAEVAVLEHFVHSNASVLNNTVYIGDQIVHPVRKNNKSYYKKANGTFAERSPGSGRPTKAPKPARPPKPEPQYTITPQSELAKRPRGRPPKRNQT